jgi:hypothetical protein
MISVGRFTVAITLAMVKVLPLPVMPSRVWCFSPPCRPATSWAMASGWSPRGSKGLFSWKRGDMKAG